MRQKDIPVPDLRDVQEVFMAAFTRAFEELHPYNCECADCFKSQLDQWVERNQAVIRPVRIPRNAEPMRFRLLRFLPGERVEVAVVMEQSRFTGLLERSE